MDLLGELQRGFGDSYRIERELGGGGMSRVFVATETALGRTVVIKVLAPELMLGVSAERFKREIAVAAQLQHPHIVPVLSAGEATDRDSPWRIPYYTMPFVDGESLRARVANGPVPPAEAVSILRDVAKALAYAHARGVVHRDIKPDNVLLTGNSAVVTDFGVAKAIVAARSGADELTHAGSTVGTPSYMAPEQASGSATVDHRADIYSFGVMALEMLTGKRPPDATLPGDAPPLLTELVTRCLERDPARRPQSAAQLVQVLENVTSGDGSARADLAPWHQRYRGRLALAGAVIVVAVLAGIIAGRWSRGATLLQNERILVGDFRSAGADTTLASVVTDAFRIALGQSRNVSVMAPASMRDALQRMERDVHTPIEGAVAREVATREGVKAYVDGQVAAAGNAFVISARLTETASGEIIATFEERAGGRDEILAAIDRLTRALRERVGDSFRQIAAAAPLEKVTTPSIDALRAYVEGSRALALDGDFPRARLLLEEAIRIDTAFSMAYRKLAVEMNNRSVDPELQMEYLTKAYRHRDRLTEAERYLTMGSYFQWGPEADIQKAIAAVEALAELDPRNVVATSNAAFSNSIAHDVQRAEMYAERVTKLPAAGASFLVAANRAIAVGDTARARWALRSLIETAPRHAYSTVGHIHILYALGDVDSSLALAQRFSAGSADLLSRAAALRFVASIHAVRGQLDAARAALTRSALLRAQAGATLAFIPAIDSAFMDAWFAGDRRRARRIIDRALAAHPVAQTSHLLRPYAPLVRMLALVGRVDAARAVARLFDEGRHRYRQLDDERTLHSMNADIAFAERRYAEAASEYKLAGEAPGLCDVCYWPYAGEAYARAGSRDSAIVLFERFLDTPEPYAAGDEWKGWHMIDATWRPQSYARLAELWEAKGDREKAARYYQRFVDLWKDADPALQPQVAAARRRLAALRSPR